MNEMSNHKTVLMVEDDLNLLNLNNEILSRNGYTVYPAKNLSEASGIIDSNKRIDIAILDVLLPDGDGLLFAGHLKKKVGCPVLILTSKNSSDDIIKGMSGEADLYMTKPFVITELIARIEGLLAKHKKEADTKNKFSEVSFGALKINPITRQAILNEENLNLTPKDFTLLLTLSGYENEIVTQSFLYEKVWGQSLGTDTTALRSAIARLRKKLVSSGYTISSSRGEGYTFEKIDLR